MPNQPDENTVATSFTLPRALHDATVEEAKRKMTNKSDIIRRALMHYLPENESAAVLKEIAESKPLPASKPVNYKKRKKSCE